MLVTMLIYMNETFQMSIRMSKMEFYCNRPTLVALIGFGLDISSSNYVEVSTDLPSSSEDKPEDKPDDKPVMDKEKVEEKGRVKGLLGYGKNRVVFYLNMNVDSVSIYLNMEDGSQLAMLVQESFLFDFKVGTIFIIKKSYCFTRLCT